MGDDDRRRWNARYAESGWRMGAGPKAWLATLAPRLPRRGRALDLAAGEGQNAVFLASLGLDVEAWDISDVGLARLAELAAAQGVSVGTRQLDLTAGAPIAPGAYALITCFHYLQRDLIAPIAAGLAEGGLVVVEILGKPSLTRHPRPSARFLVDEGELSTWFPTLETLEHTAGWDGDRFVCRLLARRATARQSPRTGH